MNEIEELHHILEVLKKFDLPISPILEYAIKEKIEILSANCEKKNIVPSVEVSEENKSIELSNISNDNFKKNFHSLNVIRPNGTIINDEKASIAFCQAIKEIGAENIYKLQIPMDGMTLVTKGINPRYASACHDVGKGYYVNTHSGTKAKKQQLERIFKLLNINWKVEIF